MHNYKKLIVWQKAKKVALLSYKLTQNFPQSELFSLTSQIRRSSTSISANLAEGSRRGKKEYKHFLSIALGSASELESHLDISADLNLCDNKECLRELLANLEEVIKILYTMVYKSDV